MYSSANSATSALERVVCQRDAPTALRPGKEAGTHSARGWVVPWASTGSEVWKPVQNTNHKLTYLLTYLLTPWSRVLLEKLTGFAASQEIPRIYGIRKFITIFTSVRHLSLS
jgi:hypothetical protein